MEKRLLLCALVLLSAACSPLVSSAATPSASHSSSPSPSPTPSPVAAVTEDVLYVRVTSLNVIWVETTTRVLRSTDHGVTWADVTPQPHGQAGSFFALDDNTAWFVTILSVASGSDIYRTLDGGRTWARSGAALPISGRDSLDFVDPLRGWATVGLGAAAGSSAVAVLRSFDGGASWTRVADTGDPTLASPSASGIAFACDKGAAAFGSRTVGVMPAICAGGPPYLYRTQDAGSHWTSVTLPNLGQQSYFSDAEFLSADDVVMAGTYYTTKAVPALLVSRDGGISWTSHPLPGAGSVAFAAPDFGWQLDSPIEATSDGGTTWTPLRVPDPPFRPSEMTLQDLGAGIAVAWSSTSIYLTEDGAATWHNVTPPQKAP